MADLSDIDRQIAELQQQKQKLVEEQKRFALEKVKAALAELNALGFNYSLSEGVESTPSKPTRSRRSGVRQEVLAFIPEAPKGVTRADTIRHFQAEQDIKAQQSISNALSNLKKAGQIMLKDGVYSRKSS